MDAPGYVICTGTLSKQADSKGNRQINFKYRRFHLAIEDAMEVLKFFKEQLKVENEKIKELLGGED